MPNFSDFEKRNIQKVLNWPDIFSGDFALDVDCEMLVLEGEETTHDYRPETDPYSETRYSRARDSGPKVKVVRPPDYFVLSRTCPACGYVWEGDVRHQDCPQRCPSCDRGHKQGEGFWLADQQSKDQA